MGTINTRELLSIWHKERNHLIQPRSLPDTEWILEAALGETLVNEVALNTTAVHDLIDGLFEHRQATERNITRNVARQRVNRVMEQLNTLPGMQAVLIPEPTTVHRPTALPSSSRAFSAAKQMVTLDRQLIDWCRQVNTLDAWLLVLAIRLMTRLGMSEKVALGTLARLTHKHIGKSALAIPSSPDAVLPEDGHYHMLLPDAVWLPLRAIVTREKERPASEWLLGPDAKAQALDSQKRCLALRKRLKTSAREMLSMLPKEGSQTPLLQLKNWTVVAHASRHVPVLRGIPPLWSTLLREYPLPTCSPVPLRLGQDGAHRYSPGNIWGRLPNRQAIRGLHSGEKGEGEAKIVTQEAAGDDAQTVTDMPAPQHETTTRPPGFHMIPTEHLPVDWRRKIKNILQQFLFDVSTISTKSVAIKKLDKQMQDLLDNYEKRLDRLMGFTGHYSAWVLHFLYRQVRTRGNKLSSAKTLLSRLTPITLLMHDAVLDLSDWDDEVVLELEISAKSGKNWAPRTLDNFRSDFRRFMRFCQHYGMLEDVTLPKSASSVAPSVLRTRIITPDHMDAMWESLTMGVPDGDPRQMKAIVIALGFYGGLRASEVESLTLNDVQFGPSNTCWIDILGGKTFAARRRVALHVMAPPSVLKQMEGWVQVRLKECSVLPLANIALFGPRHSPAAYTRKYLITPTIETMRKLLGEDIDFHGLRHAAVSWTLLRLHASQNPGFSATLHHRYHWMFQLPSLQKTLDFFCGAEGKDTLARGTILLQVAKWIGHRDPGTLLENYAHTLGMIHSDILAPPRR